MFFSKARGPFLEYLRNLTPQILIFAMVIVTLAKIAGNPDKAKLIFLLVILSCFILIFIFAVISNMTMFFENACLAYSFNKTESQRLKEEGVHGFTHLKQLFAGLWKESKIAFVEIIFVGMVVELSFLAVVFAAIPTAYNVLTMMEHKQTNKPVTPKP